MAEFASGKRFGSGGAPPESISGAPPETMGGGPLEIMGGGPPEMIAGLSESDTRPDLASLVVEHHAVLYRYAFRLSGSAADAEDLTQQAFLVAQQKLDQVRSAECVRSWLFTVLRNCYLRSFRKRVPLMPPAWTATLKQFQRTQKIRPGMARPCSGHRRSARGI